MWMRIKRALISRWLDYPRTRDAAFYRCLSHLRAVDNRWRRRGSTEGYPLGTYMEFGVWNGDSLIKHWNALRLLGIENDPRYRMIGFDSFEGMPEPEGCADDHPFIAKGAFKSNGEAYVADRLVKAGIPADRFDLVAGFYEQSLTEELKTELGRPKVAFVNIDVDYYSSTLKVLDWVEDLLFDGSIVFMDDIGFYNGNPNKGQVRAVEEFNARQQGRGLSEVPALDPAGRVFFYWSDRDQRDERLTFSTS